MKLVKDSNNKTYILVSTKGYVVYMGPKEIMDRLWKCLVRNGIAKETMEAEVLLKAKTNQIYWMPAYMWDKCPIQ